MPSYPPTTSFRLIQHHLHLHTLRLSSSLSITAKRKSSSNASLTNKSLPLFSGHSNRKTEQALKGQALARLSTSSVLRGLFLGAFFSSPVLFTPGFTLLKKISTSPSYLWNPDKNPVLRAIVRPLIYDQFCAGTNPSETRAKITQIKNLGFSGVILSYGREGQIQESHSGSDITDPGASCGDQDLKLWKRGNLETLDMITAGDYLGIKLTGCGTSITNDLLQENDQPRSFTDAIDALVQRAKAKNCRIWVDAEQQTVQPTIDRWTVDLMRKYNRDGQIIFYNTHQAYLKASRDKVEHQLQLAHREGWTLAIKLVRGAYIDNDIRERIYDTKAQTDESYNSIVRDLLIGNIKGVPTGQNFPHMRLFLAGHNTYSVSQASNLVRTLQDQGILKILPEFGQLQGMADHLGCELIQQGEETLAQAVGGGTIPMAVPRVYKCLTWGSIQECMQFLVRRAVENHGATGAVKDAMPALAKELGRRLVNFTVANMSSPKDTTTAAQKHNYPVPEPGCYAPAVTFFDPKTDKLDLPSQKKYFTYLARTGLKGLVVLGTNAETFLLNREERKTLLETARQAVPPAYPIIAGVGGHSTSQVLEYVTDAHSSGANYVLLLPCAYFGKQTTHSVVGRFYAQVATQSPLPILIYNFPAVCNGLDLESDIITDIAKKHDNIVGVKLTCGSVAKVARLAAVFPAWRFAVFGGQADFLLGGLAVGSAGCIAAFGNVFPRGIVRVFELWKEGRQKEALGLQWKLSLAEGCTKGGVASVKFAAAVMTAEKAGIEGAVGLLKPRAPYEEPDEGVKKKILDMVGSLRGLDDD
ncbi:MAG: hypothetical protein Q9192_005235 [Flavoplaca navasiana]